MIVVGFATPGKEHDVEPGKNKECKGAKSRQADSSGESRLSMLRKRKLLIVIDDPVDVAVKAQRASYALDSSWRF